MNIEEKWIDVSSKCNLCNRKRREDEHWCEEHWCGGGSGFNFYFCPQCDESRRKECDEMIMDTIINHREKTRKYWEEKVS